VTRNKAFHDLSVFHDVTPASRYSLQVSRKRHHCWLFWSRRHFFKAAISGWF